MIQMGSIISINVSESGGVPKLPLKTAIINYEGVVGDYNKFRMEKKKGDPGRAVCLFSMERILQLQKEGHPIDIGTAGENFTIEGMDWSKLEVGMTIRLGAAKIRLSEPCAPCGKIGTSFIDHSFSRIDHYKKNGWSRWSASVVEEGIVSVGDDVELIDS